MVFIGKYKEVIREWLQLGVMSAEGRAEILVMILHVILLKQLL